MAHDFLSRIVAEKKEQVRQAQIGCPLSALQDQVDLNRPSRSLIGALYPGCRRHVNIIAEVKRASPSKGDIQPNLDVADYVRAVTAGGAAALSVLTETTYFKGGLPDLVTARQHTAIPILRKDFIFSPYQLYEAAVAGADAVLLIVRILTPDRLAELIELARHLRLETLVEVHAAAEVDVALAADARLIGINNRNLQTFDTDLAVAGRIAASLPPAITVVAASGIRGPGDIRDNTAMGIHNFLIGESIARARNVQAWVRKLQAEGTDDV